MKLNPCPNPFCNNLKPSLTKSKLKHNREKPWFIWCGGCENEMGGYESKKAATDGWNNCPNEAAARAEALEEAVKAIGNLGNGDTPADKKTERWCGYQDGKSDALDAITAIKGEDSG